MCLGWWGLFMHWIVIILHKTDNFKELFCEAVHFVKLISVKSLHSIEIHKLPSPPVPWCVLVQKTAPMVWCPVPAVPGIQVRGARKWWECGLKGMSPVPGAHLMDFGPVFLLCVFLSYLQEEKIQTIKGWDHWIWDKTPWVLHSKRCQWSYIYQN